MNISPIAEITASPAAIAGAEVTQSVAPASGFDRMVMDALASVNGQLSAADTQLRAAAAGADNLHETMIALEQARLSLQLLVQVRNRFMEGYQQLMQMQI